MIRKFFTLSKEYGFVTTLELIARKLLSRKKVFYSDIYGANTKAFSIDYRENEEEVKKGEVPEKYRLLLDKVPGDKILEIGTAEGLFALSLAKNKQQVKAIDIAPYRHQKAKELQALWKDMGFKVDNCEFLVGDIFENQYLFNGIDTLVARRVIYYFREDIGALMELVKSNVRYVCLAGNPNRSQSYKEGKQTPLGEYTYYSTVEGMKELLEQYGFKITWVDETYDPTVIGENQNI